MVTLAFAQMIYFIANQWRSVTGGENGLQGIPKNLGPLTDTINADSFYFYYAALPIILLGVFIAWRTVNSPFGRVLVAIRDNPARARALGYDVERYKIMAFVLSAGLAGSGRRRVLDQPRLRLAAGADLDHVRQGRAHHRARRDRHPLGSGRRRRPGRHRSRTSSRRRASTGSASSPARSSWSSCWPFRHGIWGTARNGLNSWLRKRRHARDI